MSLRVELVGSCGRSGVVDRLLLFDVSLSFWAALVADGFFVG